MRGFNRFGLSMVANRSDDMLATVIGTGVVRFEFRFVNSQDKNQKQNRCDFVVIRSDGTAARLHPSQNSDARPVIGSVELWQIDTPVQPPTPPAMPGIIDSDLQAYEAYSQSDCISRRNAQDFLQAQTEQWQPGETFRKDLSPSELFAWPLYLANTPWGRELMQKGVKSFHMVWLGRPSDHAALYEQTQDDEELVITPGRKPEVKAQAVSLISWHL